MMILHLNKRYKTNTTVLIRKKKLCFDCSEFHYQEEDFDSFGDDEDPGNFSNSINFNEADDWCIESESVGDGSLEIQKLFLKRLCHWAVDSNLSRDALNTI